MTIQRAGVHTATHHPRVTVAGSSTGYRILPDGGTVSKSAQSKIKNLAYTLSTPFRALMRQIVHSRAGDRASTGGLINIKSPASSASATKPMTVQASLADAVITMSQGTAKFKLPPPDFIRG